MKVIDLLKKTNPMDIYSLIGVSIAMNEEDAKRQKKEFIAAYKKLNERDVAANDYVIYTLYGYFYERPAARALDSFMLKKQDIVQYKQYKDLEQFMLGDQERNKRIARFDPHKIKELIEKTPLPEFVDMRLAPWQDILGAECIIVNQDDKREVAACIVDLMMSYSTDEKKSHASAIKIDDENSHNPMTLTSRRRTALARHLYQYKVLQTLNHRENEYGII